MVSIERLARCAETKRGRYVRSPDYFKAASAKYRAQHPIKWAITMARSGAKRRGYIWDIPLELAADLVTDNCYYCGSLPEPVNGIDRVDNARGYHEDNVVTACGMCNLSKRDWSRGEFEAWVRRAASHMAQF